MFRLRRKLDWHYEFDRPRGKVEAWAIEVYSDRAYKASIKSNIFNDTTHAYISTSYVYADGVYKWTDIWWNHSPYSELGEPFKVGQKHAEQEMRRLIKRAKKLGLA